MRQLSRKLLMGSALVALMGVAATACTDLSSQSDELGRIQILVVDSATNAGVGGIPATLFLPDKTTGWRAVNTSADGTGEFGLKDGGIIPGNFVVFLDLTGKGYALARGEQNYKPVTSVVGQTATVTFKLHKGLVGGPGS